MITQAKVIDHLSILSNETDTVSAYRSENSYLIRLKGKIEHSG